MQARKLLAMALCVLMLLSALVVSMSVAEAEGDVTPPIISNPSPGSPVTLQATGTSAPQTFTASYTDDAGVASVTVTLDGADVTSASVVSTSEFSYDASLTVGKHTVELTVMDAAGNTVQRSWSVTVDPPSDTSDTTKPTISSISPSSSLTLETSTDFAAQIFSASYTDEGGVASATVILDGTDVSNQWGVGASSSSFSHEATLSLGSHEIVLTVTDAAGNTRQQTWRVTVKAAKDTTAPSVIGILPGSDQTNVGVDTNIAVTFSEAMDQGSVDLTVSGVKGSSSWSGNTITFDPSSSLDNNQKYTARVSGRDVAGNSMEFSWSFTTDDGEAPRILSYSPVGDDVSVNTSVSVEFSEAMNQNSVALSVESVNGTTSWSGNTITFQPSEPLAKGSLYNANVSGMDLAGTPVEFNWNFSTEGGVPMHNGEGAISGLVKGTNGKGIGGASVVLNETVSTTTDANGAFSITNVTAGSYDLIVSKDGYDSIEKKVNVTSGLTSVVSLSIKGSVVRPLISDGSVIFMVIGGLAIGVVTLSMIWKRKGRLF